MGSSVSKFPAVSAQRIGHGEIGSSVDIGIRTDRVRVGDAPASASASAASSPTSISRLFREALGHRCRLDEFTVIVTDQAFFENPVRWATPSPLAWELTTPSSSGRLES